MAMRARCTADECRLVETREASWGRREGKSEKGGLLRRSLVDSGDSGLELLRKGGRSRSKSSRGCGSSETAGCRGCDVCGFRLPIVGAGFASGRLGFAVDTAWIRRLFLAASSRYCFSSCGRSVHVLIQIYTGNKPRAQHCVPLQRGHFSLTHPD